MLGFPARRVLRSFRFAWEGLLHIARSQRNFQVHLAVALLVGLLGVAFRLRPAEFALLALAIGFVLSAEAANSAIETLCDVVSVEINPLIKRAKDAAAAAVLLSAMAAVIVGLALFGPRIMALAS